MKFAMILLAVMTLACCSSNGDGAGVNPPDTIFIYKHNGMVDTLSAPCISIRDNGGFFSAPSLVYIKGGDTYAGLLSWHTTPSVFTRTVPVTMEIERRIHR